MKHKRSARKGKRKGRKSSKTRLTSVKKDIEQVITKGIRKAAKRRLNPAEFRRFKSKLQKETERFITNKVLSKYRIGRNSIIEMLRYADDTIERHMRTVKKTFIRKKK